ncbi:MAG: cytochrome-c peroxidase [Coriobacteriales bacterium]|nr:cytochrome-c peroxidase [Coriobacteriales bacterium]
MKTTRTTVAVALVIAVVALLLAPAGAGAATLTAKQQLGKKLFFDAGLSEPAGQACADCHHPTAGYADPDHDLPTSRGVIQDRFGGRNAPTAAYASLIPTFGQMVCCNMGSTYRCGQFWDGRAATLVEQAKGPFLNPLEMNNPSKDTVVRDVKASSYASLFRQVYGSSSLNNVAGAYDKIADAIAAYEGSPEVNTYSSKYDAYVAGRTTLTAQESLGMSLFNGRGRCFRCHGSCGMGGGRMGSMGSANKAFSNFTYHNVGVPKNAANPYYTLPAEFNPAGYAWIDYGLGGVLKGRGVSGWELQNGKHRVQTLRNIAKTGPYMHNGAFTSVRQVVEFYNSRDTGAFGPAEVPQNLSADVGNLGLTSSEVDAIVAFLNTLSDGY